MGQYETGMGRHDKLCAMAQEQFDVLIIGGGITGAGIALDAQTRGMRTALIEMQDFAAGTSSRSTKLVHGGLRYLKQFEVKMVAEVGKERAVVYENGPHVTTPEWMLLPLYKGGTYGKLATAVGLRVYDFLAGVKRSERRTMLNPQQTLEKEPLLAKDGLKGGGYYVEYRTDDARLTIEVMKEAASRGAAVINYAKAEELLYEGGKLVGVRVRDMIGGREYTLRASSTVNATGPWVDSIRELDRSRQGKTLRLTKGIHLVFDGSRFPLRQAIYFDTTDGRMLFAIPRDGKTYVGTTDTDYASDPTHPGMTAVDRDYVLQAANGMFPSLKLKPSDVESSWAGLRPLIYQEGKSPSEVSRRDEIFHSPSGLMTIAGGKLTGYRKMAEAVVDQLAERLERRERQVGAAGTGAGAGAVAGSTGGTVSRTGAAAWGPSRTKQMPIAGGDVGGAANWPAWLERHVAQGEQLGLAAATARQLVQRYGSNVVRLFSELAKPQTAEAAEQAGLPPELYVSVRYAIQGEFALKPADFFIRRTGALFFDIAWAHAWKQPVAALMAQLLDYTEEQHAQYLDEFERELDAAVQPRERD